MLEWKPTKYTGGPRGHEIELDCKYSITSTCRRYRISRGKSGNRTLYHVWALCEVAPPGTRYSAGSGRAHCVYITDSADDAKQLANALASGSGE